MTRREPRALATFFVIFLICASTGTHLHSTVLVIGPASKGTVFTFGGPIIARAYDRATGTFYVALGEPGGKYMISRAIRPIGDELPSFEPSAQFLGETSSALNLLTLVTNEGNRQPFLAYAYVGINDEVAACPYDGSIQATVQPVLGANGGNVSGIYALAGMLIAGSAAQGFIFAAVSQEASGEPPGFGGAGSGIAVICLRNPAGTSGPSLYQTAAEGGSEVRARRLDGATPEIAIGEPGQPLQTNVTPVLHWDGALQRLYIGLGVAAAAPGSGACSVVTAALDADNCGQLNLIRIAPESAVGEGVNNIVAYLQPQDVGGTILDVYGLRTMHCTTGPSYLIVNSDLYNPNKQEQPYHNYIYALPLVDLPVNQDINGTIADRSSQLVRGKFVTAATEPGQLPTDDNVDAVVGLGPLPIADDTPVADMEVIGDTVFIAIAAGSGPEGTNGILYSQALFEKTGKIVSWTPWTKRAYPFNDFFDGSCVDKGVRFFSVDAVTGMIWAVDGYTQKIVHATAWDRGASCPKKVNACAPSSQPCCQTRCAGCHCAHTCQGVQTKAPVCKNLPSQLRASLGDGCYSALDLDQATRGFTGEGSTPNRFALFGGKRKVAFARTSIAFTTSSSSQTTGFSTPQSVIEDFSVPENFLVTTIPAPGGCVKVLEYSRRTEAQGSQCFFFAGTDKGLYVFAKEDGEGFTPSELNLDQAITTTGKWHPIESFQTPIVDIKTTGLGRVYITTRVVESGTMKSTVYGVDYGNSISDMFDNPDAVHILAQSYYTPFQNALAFYGAVPLVTAVSETGENIESEQLSLATNDGLFSSNAADPGGISTAGNQRQARWQRTPSNNNNGTMFAGIMAAAAPFPSTAWLWSVEDTEGLGTFEASSIYQISSRATEGEPESGENFGSFAPQFFNARVQTRAFEHLDPITYFWSDGARRFFIINRQSDPATINKIMSFPYDTPAWNVCSPGRQVLGFDPYLISTKRFFWIKHIGFTGILMAGTESGVIALE